MTAFDYAFLGLLGLSLLLGVWRGLISEVFALASWIVALVAAWRLADFLAAFLVGQIHLPWARWLAAFLIVFVVVLLVLAVLRFTLRELLKVVGLNPLDRFLGAGFGVLRALVVAVLLVAAGGLTTLPKESWWSESVFAPPLETAVIAAKPWLPKELAVRIKYR